MTAHAIGVHHGHRKPHQRRPLSSLLPWHLRARSASETTAPDALSRGGHPEEVPVQDSATGEAAPLAAPVRDVVAIAESAMHATMSEPFGTVSFTGASTAGLAEGWPKYDDGAMTGPLQQQPWTLATEQPPESETPEPDPCAAAADTMADPGCTTVTGGPRPFSPAEEDTAAPFPVAFLRAFGPDGKALTEEDDEQLFGPPFFTRMLPAGTERVAEVIIGEGPEGSYAIAGNGLYLRSLAAVLLAAAGKHDAATAEVTDAGTAEPAEADAAPLAAETEPEVPAEPEAAAPADEPAGTETAAETADSEAA